MAEAGIDGKYEGDFATNIAWLVADYKKRQTLERLPAKPLRAFKPRKESFESYLVAPDGLGPWVEAGVLTSPMMEDLSPKAYSAYFRHLQVSKLPDGITIPTRSAVVEADLEDVLKGMRGSSVYRWLTNTSISTLIRKYNLK
jgi:hypothetical protein